MLSNIQNRLQHDWREESIWNLLYHRRFIKKTQQTEKQNMREDKLLQGERERGGNLISQMSNYRNFTRCEHSGFSWYC